MTPDKKSQPRATAEEPRPLTSPTPEPSDAHPKYDRRGFFRSLLRLGALGILAGGGASLLRRGGGEGRGESCVSDGICPRCGVLASCGLPQALSLKAARAAASDRKGDAAQ